jgi:hypothetical protein
MRLLTIFWLVIASFFSANSFASIFDAAPYVSPKIDSVQTWLCKPLGLAISRGLSADCLSRVSTKYNALNDLADTDSNDYTLYSNFQLIDVNLNSFIINVTATRTLTNDVNQHVNVSESIFQGGQGSSPQTQESRTCPPDDFPLMSYGHDQDGDGKYDKCLNPNVLADLSDCSAAPDFLGNASGRSGEICMTQPNGAQCGYLAGTNGSMVQSNSVSCYDDTPVDEFGGDDVPSVEPNQCLPFGTGYVCSAKAVDVCYGGVCPNNCGTANGQFVCFNDTPNLPDPTDPTDPSNDLDPTEGDPANPDPVNPTDPTNPVSADIAQMTNRLGDLITLTRNKGNDVIYAVNKQTGDLVTSLSHSNNSLSEISQKLTNPNNDLVAAVDRTTGEVLSVMRESQVKLAELGDNVFLTKDIQQGTLEVATQTKAEVTKGFDNIIEFMKSVDTPDPVTGESKMDVLQKTNSDGFAEMQNLLNALLDSPGIKAPGGGSGETPDPEPEPDEIAPDPKDFSFDAASAKARMDAAFDTLPVDAEILVIKQNMLSTFNSIKSAFTDKFSVDTGSSGALPSLGVISYQGNQTDVALSPYSEQLNWIGLALFFITTVSCMIIVFK